MVRIKVDADIELKAMEQGDRALVFNTVDQNRGHLRKWLPWVDYMTSAEDYIGVIKAWQEDIDNGVGLQLGIFHKGKFVGMCGYNEIFKSEIYRRFKCPTLQMFCYCCNSFPGKCSFDWRFSKNRH